MTTYYSQPFYHTLILPSTAIISICRVTTDHVNLLLFISYPQAIPKFPLAEALTYYVMDVDFNNIPTSEFELLNWLWTCIIQYSPIQHDTSMHGHNFDIVKRYIDCLNGCIRFRNSVYWTRVEGSFNPWFLEPLEGAQGETIATQWAVSCTWMVLIYDWIKTKLRRFM